MKPLYVTVMLGGPSAERDVSLASGRAVASALRALGHSVSELDPRDDSWQLPAGTDVVFLALHGTYGEDGSVQERLEQLDVPYTGCGPAASRIAFDKVTSKECFLKAGVPTARFCVVRSESEPWPAGWAPPLVIKPVRQGSSVGLHFLEREDEWGAAIKNGLRYDTGVLVEERIIGRETTVGILDGRALPVVEVRPKQGGYDYRNKYTKGATEYFCPAEFSGEGTKRIQDAGVAAFEAIGGRDYGRVDVMVRQSGDPVVLEVNTLPGMTETSLLPKAAAAAGLSYEVLCQRMIELALARRAGVAGNTVASQ